MRSAPPRLRRSRRWRRRSGRCWSSRTSGCLHARTQSCETLRPLRQGLRVERRARSYAHDRYMPPTLERGAGRRAPADAGRRAGAPDRRREPGPSDSGRSTTSSATASWAAIRPSSRRELRDRARAPRSRRTWPAPSCRRRRASTTVRRMMDFVAGAEIPEHYAPFLMEELRSTASTRSGRTGTSPKLKAAAPRLPVVIVGAGMSGLLAAHPPAAGRRSPSRSSRRTPTSAAPGWRTPIPAAASTIPTTSIPTRSSRTTTGRITSRPQPVLLGLLPGRRRQVRPARSTSASRPRSIEAALRRGRRALEGARSRDKDGKRRDARRQCGDHRRRPAQPAAPARHQGPRRLQGPVVPLRALGSRRRPEGQARRVIGTGASAFQFVPEIAPDVAHLTVFQRTPPWLGADAELSRQGHGGREVAAQARSLLRQVVPLLAVLDADRRHLRGRQGRSELERRPGRRSAPANDMLREMLIERIRAASSRDAPICRTRR